MNILFATSNPHKIDEVASILLPHGIVVRSLSDLDIVPDEPIEDAPSFEGNARLKAIGYAQATGERCLADDSGLEVDALGGAPGVHSARWSGIEGDRASRDAANNAKLIEAMGDMSEADRSARFVCAMCLAEPDGTIVAESRGTFDGVITLDPKGDNGFGYDPLLYLPDRKCTSAELSPMEKNAKSHRGEATRQLLALLTGS